MNTRLVHNAGHRMPFVRGYSMIEMMVAIFVALFLLTGMFSILQGTRKTSGNQNLLAQLQDEERVAMTMMTDVIQQAGYFPGAQSTDPTTELLVTPAFTTAGQAVVGGTNANGDTVTVRYQGDTTNNVLDCSGNVVSVGVTEEMTFSVKAIPNTISAQNPAGVLALYCDTTTGTSVPLVSNVHTIAVTYGIDANTSGSANTYLTAGSMAGNWLNVYSVNIKVSFVNPLYGQPGQTGFQYLPFSRVIGIMSRTGVNTLYLQ